LKNNFIFQKNSKFIEIVSGTSLRSFLVFVGQAKAGMERSEMTVSLSASKFFTLQNCRKSLDFPPYYRSK